MRIDLPDLWDLLNILDVVDWWKAARDAEPGTKMHRWRYVVQGLVLLVMIPTMALVLLAIGLLIWSLMETA